jgi:hypothetical protein
MSKHVTISPTEAADRLAIRELYVDWIAERPLS